LQRRLPALSLCALLLTAPLLGALLAGQAAALPPPTVGSSTDLSNPYNETQELLVDYAPTGEGVAAWVEVNSSTYSVWSARFSPASGWTPATFHYAATASVGFFSLAVDAAGNATLLWVSFTSPYAVWFARSLTGGATFGPALVRNASTTISGPPPMEVGADGTAYAFWSEGGGTSASYAVAISPAGALDGPTRIDGGSTAVFEKNILPDPTGSGASAVWCDRGGSVADLMEARYAPAAGWSAGVVVAANLSNGCARMDAGIDGSGNAIVVSSASYNRSLVAIRRDAAGSWLPPQPLWTPSSSLYVDIVRVAVADGGGVAVAWRTTDLFTMPMQRSIYVASWTATTGWTAAVPLVENVTSPANVRLAIASGGSAIALFSPPANATSTLSVSQLTRLWGCAGWSAPSDAGLGGSNYNYLAVGLAPSGGGHIIYRIWNGAVWQARAAAVSLDLPSGSLSVTSPPDDSHVTSPVGVVTGTADPGAFVSAGGARTQALSDGSFSLAVPLVPGANALVVGTELGDPWTGCHINVSLTIVFDDPIPGLIADLDTTRAQLNATQADLGAAQARIAALEASGNATQAELDAALADLAAANETLERMKGDFSRLTANLTATQEELDRVKVPFPWLESNLTDAQASLDVALRDLAEAQARVQLLEAQQNQSSAVLTDTADSNAALSGQVATLSLISSIALLAAVAAVGLVLYMARGGGGGGGASGRGAHEVAHVVQQGGGDAPGAKAKEFSPAEEQLKGAPRH